MSTRKYYVTPRVQELTGLGFDFSPYVERHLNGDWSAITEQERQRNLDSLQNGPGHVFSVYQVTPNVTIWITTQNDRTVVMLPLA